MATKIGYKKIAGDYYEVYGPGNRPTTIAKGKRQAQMLAKVRRNQSKMKADLKKKYGF